MSEFDENEEELLKALNYYLDADTFIKYKIHDWKKHNTVLDYNCPCQKDTGFFFMPTVIATELVALAAALI